MAKLLLVYVIVILALIYSGSATNYMVGDNSGWYISTDLDTWLHCLGGMKLHVNVEDNINKMASPAALPVPQAGASHFPTHSSKTNNPSTIVPCLTNLPNQVSLDSVLVATLGFPIDSFINMSNIRTNTTELV
ncbi:hypothetical protein RDI58_007677 [Solanum bulbocastanum]|uniref:Phytocyanin domain-containing protein n=1 Tax=Solanum bulbocastanum TaxID=147425 RepID=A0AAN8TWT3_SOLBU